ncbi:MAG TPA: LarC family nickel insertion protein [Stellaceae bacterium]|nr:LarC family nickel insertion protein [Stellaceae bacterium]
MSEAPLPSLVVLDPVGGVSGDMFIAAMLDGWPGLAPAVLQAINRSGLPPGSQASLVERRSGGLAGAGFVFEGSAAAPSGSYPAFRQRLAAAPLSPSIRDHALAILALLAEAEATVHRVPIERVHFHELADWDTQADLVGAAAIIDLLQGARWHCRPLPLGSGTVRSAHGLLPVPAPATAHLLADFAFRADDGAPGERVTPTGAAILRYLAPRFAGDGAPGKLLATGTGAGTRQLPGIPNILRVLGFAAAESPGDAVLVIEFDIDDQSPEELATGLDRLRLVSGVRDVATFAGIGKKGRWLQAVRVMADPAHRDAVVAAVFEETSTLGLRLRREERAVLARQTVVVEDESGPLRVKVAERRGGRTGKAEADDIAERGGGAEARARLRRSAVARALRAAEETS